MNVRDYVEHIVKESAKVFEGTTCQDTWMFYHDALSLMTCPETEDWMREKGYLKRWIRPEFSVQYPSDLKRSYHYKFPPGNSPELNTLDNRLNKDIHDCVRYHCLITACFKEEPQKSKKFSMATPKTGQFAYQRLLEPATSDVPGVVPTSEHIIRDHHRVISAFEQVREADGCIIDEYLLHSGHRRPENVGKGKRGGYRPRTQAVDNYCQYDKLHPDAAEGSELTVTDSTDVHSGKKKRAMPTSPQRTSPRKKKKSNEDQS